MNARQLNDVLRIGGELPALFQCYKEIKTLQRLAKKLHRLCENYCNGDVTEETFDMKHLGITSKVNQTLDYIKNATSYDFTYNTQNDPRGAELEITLKGLNITNLIYP